MKTKRKKMSILNIMIYSILILAALSCTLPFIHILALSFSSSSAVASGKVAFWPVDFTTFSYEFARYEQAPEDVAAREIEERAGKVVETEE